MGTGVGVEEGVSVSPAARAKALLCKTVCPLTTIVTCSQDSWVLG